MSLTHHSYVIYADLAVSDIPQDFIKVHNFQDIEILNIESFGIDDSRNLVKKAYIQPSGINAKKLIVVKVGNFTIEAEQALLKILEEPPASTIFLFILTSQNLLIPTLKSRFLEYKVDVVKKEDNKSFAEFYALDYKGRLALIIKKLDKNDVLWLKEIKTGASDWLSLSLLSLKTQQRQSLQTALLSLGMRGASNKMLLEEIAFTIPYTAEK